MAKIYYNKLLTGCLDGSFSFDDIPAKYQPQVKALAVKDLESGKLPLWQFELMFPEGVE